MTLLLILGSLIVAGFIIAVVRQAMASRNNKVTEHILVPDELGESRTKGE